MFNHVTNFWLVFSWTKRLSFSNHNWWWIAFLYYYDPESKQSLKEWKRTDLSAPPTKLTQEKSAGKVLYSFFWDHKGIILRDRTSVGITITKTFDADISVSKLHPEIKKQRWDLISTDVILRYDNALAHTSFLVSCTIHDLKYELLRHPSHYPDVARSDYFILFPVSKDYLKGRHYNDRSSLGSSIYRCLKTALQLLHKNFQNVGKTVFRWRDDTSRKSTD